MSEQSLDPQTLDPPAILHDRLLEIEGVFNFRDVGGLPTRNGGELRRGLVFRSATLDGIGEAGLARMADLGIRTVADLRGRHEVNEHGSFPAEAFAAAHHPVNLITFAPDFGPPTETAEPDGKAADIRRMAFEADDPMSVVFPAMVEVFDQPLVETLRLVTEPDNHGIVFHCTSGKDRTGYVAAIVQLIAGVDPDTVIDDFVASAHFAAHIRADMESRYPEMMAFPEHKRARMSTVDAAWLQLALDRMGGTEGLSDHLAMVGFGTDEQDGLRRVLTC